MSKLIKIPGGSWVAPGEVASVTVVGRELDEPLVVVVLKGGYQIRVDEGAAKENRDKIAQAVNAALEGEAPKG